MAEFSTLVSAVHAVYSAEGGDYDESTAPVLMQVASTVKNRNQAKLRRLTDSTETVRENMRSEILAELRRRAE
jgi:hypothetical protein